MQVHILGATYYPLACTSVTVACVHTQTQSGHSGFDTLIQGDQSVGWNLCPESGPVWGLSVVCLCVLYCAFDVRTYTPYQTDIYAYIRRHV
ncbi:hypothetical protein ASPBRDRAFT_594043 [Aspergillus brasiliensis CBS 101740]|uniref:Uncharacterized protein n=1 Tax=Aspergillus brasiliensis (strain CBS 101740 / IMI 381727 / IBT 21946) TaxID=767769 RepID=A0A1L9UGY3_ASPBC|nr:hypothetical protein ASPBRDRAFT_594043 [Aspergillus brasiliensis CBS 101740]